MKGRRNPLNFPELGDMHYLQQSAAVGTVRRLSQSEIAALYPPATVAALLLKARTGAQAWYAPYVRTRARLAIGT